MGEGSRERKKDLGRERGRESGTVITRKEKGSNERDLTRGI